MAYTSKTSAEIMAIIKDLEDSMMNVQVSGSQKVDYNGIKYEISSYIDKIEAQISFWEKRLQIALQNEGKLKNPIRFKRSEGYV